MTLPAAAKFSYEFIGDRISNARSPNKVLIAVSQLMGFAGAGTGLRL